MALKTFLFVITNCLCIYFCYCAPKNDFVPFDKFVLDGKIDCGYGTTNANANKLFKVVSCPSQVRIFFSDYFAQRFVLPCFGAYDALYNLCDFSSEKINFTIPEPLKDPKRFCAEAENVYEHLSFKYTSDQVKRWADALQSTMKNETHCNNLCVLDNIINEQCIAMVTLAQEYLRLKGVVTSGSKVKSPTSVDPLKNIKTTVPESNPVSNSTVNDKIDSLNTKNSSESVIQSSGVIASSNIDDPIKGTQAEKQNIDSEPKPVFESEDPPKQSPIANTQNTDVKVPETQSLPEEKKPVNVNTLPSTSTVSVIANIPPNGPSNMVDEGLIDDNDKTATEGDDFHGENEEAIPGEAKEKGNPDEENEKPIVEEKNTVADTEQHAAYHAGGMSSSFNPMGDSFSESEDSYSFTYIVTTMAALCCVYLLFHYRNKLLALALEGRKGRSSRGRGRPSSANYSKLHSNLEEAIASNVTTPSATHVLY